MTFPNARAGDASLTGTTPGVTSLKANLLDETGALVDSVLVDGDETYSLNGYFTSPDGGVYLICELKAGEPRTHVELSGIWIDGPHPTSRLKGHS